MPIALTDTVPDGTAAVATVTFEDENGDAVIPDSITWSLYDPAGAIVNTREDIAVAVPAASVDILIEGANNLYSGGYKRVFVIKAVVDLAAGNDQDSNESATYQILDIPGV